MWSRPPHARGQDTKEIQSVLHRTTSCPQSKTNTERIRLREIFSSKNSIESVPYRKNLSLSPASYIIAGETYCVTRMPNAIYYYAFVKRRNFRWWPICRSFRLDASFHLPQEVEKPISNSPICDKTILFNIDES
ncbi:hypothetical protein CEXT_222631 [Caerostris extrusa]|uniref:Uncharacterized protein n=1 Tax=Caerostris extrusa TaxID=172846 RepID=A0AAV4Q7X6_CAEEX|nr:hypothetical protein CEXT_222631 [Caerostris extrusa]